MRALFLSIAALFFFPTSANAIVITFDGLGTETIFTSATIDGFLFTSEHFHLLGDGYFASNGTTYLAYESGRGHPISMSMIGGGTFSLLGLDGAEAVTSSPQDRPAAEAIGVLGFLADGGTVYAELVLDGIHDGGDRRSASDFQGFALSFTNLTSVLFYGIRADGRDGGIALDNLWLEPGVSVPEPGSLTLFGLGLVAMGFARRRQMKSTP